MPPPFAFFNDTHHHDSPDDETAVKATPTERQDSSLLNAIEERAVAELRAALREQELALLAALDQLGGPNEAVIVANAMRVMDANADPLQLAMYRILVSGAQAGITAVSQALPYNMAIGVDWKLSNANAEQFALNYSYDLVSRVQQTTRKGIGQAVARWVKDGGKLSDLADSIRPLIAQEPSTRIIEQIFSVDRATMIAETEATRAYARGKIEGYTSSGLAQQAPTQEPPKHIRCRCDVRPDSDADGSWWWIWLTANDSLVCPVCGPLHKQRVGLARPAPLPDDAKAVAIHQQPIRKTERLFFNKSRQNMAVYGTDGRLLHIADGTARQVRAKGVDAKTLVGSTIVFNQPGCYGFSATDVAAAHAYQVAQLRMVGVTSEGGAWRYVIKPNASFFKLDAKTLETLAEQAQRKVMAEMVIEVVEGSLLREHANNEYWHRFWRDVDARLKQNGRARLGYKREGLYD